MTFFDLRIIFREQSGIGGIDLLMLFINAVCYMSVCRNNPCRFADISIVSETLDKLVSSCVEFYIKQTNLRQCS